MHLFLDPLIPTWQVEVIFSAGSAIYTTPNLVSGSELCI